VSDNTARLRRQLDSAVDLQSVVRAMKAMAASSIVQYEQSLRALGDYYRTVELGLSVCLRQSPSTPHADLQMREARPDVIGAVVFGSDQGLVGQFNERVVEYAVRSLAALPKNARRVWAMGERVYSLLGDAGLPLAGLYAVPNSIQGIAPLVGQILIDTEAGGDSTAVTQLHLFYNQPITGSGAEVVDQRLLPLDDDWRRRLVQLPWPNGRSMPDAVGGHVATLRALIREYLFISLFRACTESLASENASRLAAMQRADKNIDELLERLRGAFNRIRQSDIDEELFDVISGFEALNASTHEYIRSRG